MINSKARRLKMCQQTLCRYFLRNVIFAYVDTSDTFTYKTMVSILNTHEVRLWCRYRRCSHNTYSVYRIGYFENVPRIVNVYGNVGNICATKHFDYGQIWRSV